MPAGALDFHQGVSHLTAHALREELTFEVEAEMNRRLLAGVFCIATMGLQGAAQAQTTSEQMTCAQAVATYERNGRIYVRTRSGTVIPIYQPAPVSQRSQVFCRPRETRTRYNVRTSDKRHCTIGYYCTAQ